ncbi:excalibur calcium-binding domain-containing protein [Streptomyces sp. NPDC002896]|uniref:excalibur calcium-binding domain-containing protein n=1 Tax=Streptomyces sp. NPDC002896 TaxID=3154438 RepID=UPI00332B63E2
MGELDLLPPGAPVVQEFGAARWDTNPVAAASASAEEKKPEYVEVADYTGMTLAAAERSAKRDGFHTDSHDASDKDTGQWDTSAWTVCFQSPTKVKSDITPSTVTVDFGVVRNGVPCPASDGEAIDYNEMPRVVGMTYADAEKKINDKTSVTDITAVSAYIDVADPDNPDSWKVCAQDPKAGKEITNPDLENVTLDVVKSGTSCPSGDDDLYLHKDENEDDDNKRSSGSSNSSSSGSSSSDSDSGSASVYYKNCTAVRAAGADPIRKGQPGYASHLDRDGDGIGCDT